MRKSIYVILRNLVAAYNRYTRMASWGKYKYIMSNTWTTYYSIVCGIEKLSMTLMLFGKL